MRKTYRKWMSLVLVLAMLMSLLPAMSAYAATARITIKGVYVSDTQPTDESLITRLTSSPVDISATIENISDSQLSELYYEVTNMTTTKTPVVEKTNKAQKSDQFDITFKNVTFTEGLNKIVIKLGETSVISSAPGWVYFTPTTTLTTININGQAFQDGKMYPENPAQSTVLNISGTAPNATEVKAYTEGNPNPINAYLSNGEFFFVADDVNNSQSTANLRLRAGDNPMTIMAVNNTKTYQINKNLIYNNGLPFAFNAKIKELPTPPDPSIVAKDLIKNPTVTTSKVNISALLKNDLTTLGDLQYNFVDVLVGGQRFGPYNLSGAAAAPKTSGVAPNIVYEGHSTTRLFVSGEALSSSIKLTLTDNVGAVVLQNKPPEGVNSSKTAAVYDFPAGTFQKAKSPYKVELRNGDAPAPVLHKDPYSVTVNAPASPLPPVVSTTVPEIDAVSPASPIFAKAGQTPMPQPQFVVGGVLDPADFAVSYTDLTGKPVGQSAVVTSSNDGTNTTLTFAGPTVTTEGLYKYKLTYKSVPLTETAFEIARKDPDLPTAQITGSLNMTKTTSPTTIYVAGTNLGTIAGDIVNPRLVNLSNAADVIPLKVFEVRGTAILFQPIANNADPSNPVLGQTNLTSGANYKITFEKQMRYPNGDLVTGLIPTVSTGDVVTNSVYVSTATSPANVDAVTTPQVLLSEVNTASFSVQGNGFTDSTRVSVIVANEDGTNQRSARIASVSPDGKTILGDFTNISGISAGTYLLRVAYNNVLLGQYPFTIADPSPTGFTTSGSTMSVTGINFGRDISKLKLRFVSNDNASYILEAMATGIVSGRTVNFTKPSDLSNGTYTVSVLYNDNVVGNPFVFSVSATASQLNEVSEWSQPGKYKVFNFSADLDIPSDRTQLVQFKFYNTITDDIPVTAYTFNYVNNSLPYVESVDMLSERVVNNISELPKTFRVLANAHTQKLNLYLGEFTNNSSIYATVPYDTDNQPTDSTTGVNLRVFTFSLPATIPNGPTQLTIVPSSDSTYADKTKTAENLSGKKQYDLLISNTPYLIVNNIYNGMVVKTPGTQITCDRGGLTGSCVSGRIVNIPNVTAGGDNRVEVTLNGIANTSMLVATDNTFTLLISDLREGKNTLVFKIYINKVLVTTTSYEIFVFSTDAPEFISVNPVETTDVKKFIAGTNPDTYATSETAVAFSGQFANASEVRLTVRTKDANGTPVVKYDRRYGSNYGNIEPQSNNPGYFNSIGSGQFRTNSIPLLSKGDTIFEFSIMNASGITVTKVITINREPLPYIIKSPKLIKNEKNEDQANINSNYVEVQIEAENATSVLFGKEEAVVREVTENGVKKNHFFYEVTGLKAGKNTVRFTVVRGTEKSNGSFVLYNTDTAVEGAQYKAPLQSTTTVFDGQLSLKFPKGTNFIRNEPGAINQFLTSDRKILYGIASKTDGRVDKIKHPSATDGQIGNPNPVIDGVGKLMLTETTGRFRSASNLFWVDAGTIKKNETDMIKALNGSGRLPYDKEEFYLRTQQDMVVPTERGTLTLKYDSYIRDDAWKYLSVYHFDIYEDYTGIVQGRWKNLGGVVDAAKNTITVPFETFGYYQVVYMDKSFDDVTGHPWARNDLDTLYAKGYMQNKESSSFVPNDSITRGEFATMLVKIFDLPLQYTEVPTFSDVQRVNLLTKLYDYKYIETAAKAGIVRGAAGGRFMPDNAVTRQDAAIMIARAADLKLQSESNLDKVLANLRKSFTDGDSIDIYARTAVEAVTNAGLIQGKENVLLQGQTKTTVRFDPLETFTRAEAAAVAIRVLKNQKKIPK
ncbi:S-layer homology domain-containing protein [Paenibacillus mesophilus]|uniref:S-layer homology domain-containing protein n=1 Tax=Paenibacillus mesophilus TaxID=2582849 RepID=UPI00110DF7E7|nr:S-layer homology domain-containing protein [Paenibacillus mesophilus]TMV47158.1 S-layer homology domain-containing protein [Paenibacillus mesophilus]